MAQTKPAVTASEGAYVSIRIEADTHADLKILSAQIETDMRSIATRAVKREVATLRRRRGIARH